VEFSTLTRTLGVSKSVLSKHLARLEDVGVIQITKTSRAGHLWTSVALTDSGRADYVDHIAALRTIVGF
jgi:DNA-binding HxlR family transcriptional regulator